MDDGRRLTLIVIGHPKDLKIYDICSKKNVLKNPQTPHNRKPKRIKS